jgi:excisionase family DNA binding protein
MSDDPQWMTTGDVARYLQVTVTTVLRWIQAGKLPCIQTPGGRYRISRAEFMAWVEKAGVAPRPARGTLRILVADDEEDTHELIRTFLSTLPMPVQVECCRDGREAAERIPDFGPHVLLVDLMMPRMNGFELCGFARGHPRTRESRIIVLTGFGNPENLSAAQKCGAHRVIQKPYKAAQLTEAILDLVGDMSLGD